MEYGKLITPMLVLVLGFVLGLSTSGHAQDFYKGKTFRILVGLPPGGSFDLYSRTLARHMGKHIPGNPKIMVVNMPGAGSLVAANYLFNVARPDGLMMGNFLGHLVLSQVLGESAIQFDARRFRWVGIPEIRTGACAVTKASGVTTIEEWRAAKDPVKLGAVAPGTVGYFSAKVLKDVIGLPTQIITGYGGSAAIRVASDRGEIDGGCWQWESIKATWGYGLDEGKVRVLLQFGREPHPDLTDVPLADSLAKTNEARLLLRAAVEDVNNLTVTYALPPGTPEDRVQILRNAFMATMRDSGFLADAQRANLSVRPVGGTDLEKIVQAYFELESSLVNELRRLLVKK